MAGRWRARESQGLADHRRVSSTDGDVAQRVGPPSTRRARRRRRRGRRAGVRTRPRRRRHAHAAAPVLSPGAHAGVPGRPDPACRRRADDVRDRPGPARPRQDGRAAHQPGEAAHQEQRRRIPDATGSGAVGADGVGAARAVPDLQRRLDRELRLVAASRRAVERGDPPDTAGARPAARRRRGGRVARADAADRRPASGANPSGRRAWSRSRNRTAAPGTRGPSRKASR